MAVNEAREPLAQLLDAVSEMRHAQREYFRTRSQAALATSKAAESRVDRLVRELSEPSLFSN